MDLGLAELIRSGKTPQQAAELVTRLVTEPEVLAMLVELAQSPEGRELLIEGCSIWAGYGLCAPWAEFLETASVQQLSSAVQPERDRDGL